MSEEQRAYSYEELGAIKRQVLDICEQVARDNPTAWRQAHNGNFDETSTRYNDLCVQALRGAGIYAGCNGKRGGDQRSDDVLVFGLTDGRGARDTSGRFPSIAIIDFINGAGGPNPAVGWGDVSQAAPGKFLDPQGLARIDGGGGPEPTPTPNPTPNPTPVPTPSPGVDLSAVMQRLDAIERAVAEKPSRGDIRQEMNELVLGSEVMGFLREELNNIATRPYNSGGCVLRRGDARSAKAIIDDIMEAAGSDPETPRRKR
jgi:hypothetical protein